jgi:hypothetical protein
VHSSTQGCQIVSCLHVFGSARHEDHSDDESPLKGGAAGQVDSDLVWRRHWTLAELEQFGHVIIEGQAMIDRLRTAYPGRFDFSLRSQPAKLPQEISARSWPSEEDRIILECVKAGQTEQLAQLLRGRN